ncbi:MAG: ATP-binding protein [Kofleriaceae bacterium]
MPYRTVDHDERAEAPVDQGIVGDVVAQFADPLAFYRELIQNSIDAGTPSIEVRLAYDEPARLMRVTVRDRGDGMSREIVEDQLLVLFRSTKEHDETKIGKFGIGFKSVLAPRPNLVIVQTARQGQRLTLHLHPDLTYELYDAGPAAQSGTSVELELAMEPDLSDDFIERTEAALVRWCRHASVPIELEARRRSGDEVAVRIDRPLALEHALVEVRDAADDGKLVCVVGLVTGTPAVGFFNHGLMLHETEEPLFGGVAAKIQDSRLGHTLSRDNVRRDDRYTRAVSHARALIDQALIPAVTRELAVRAQLADLRPYYELVNAIERAKLELPADAWVFPLVSEHRATTRATIRASELQRRAWGAAHPSPLTAVLAARGTPVLHLSPASQAWLQARVARSAHAHVASVNEELTAVAPVTLADTDHALLDLLSELLEGAYRRPPSIGLAKLTGACADQLVIADRVGDSIATPDPVFVLDQASALRNPFGKLLRLPLVLSVTHPTVVTARAGDPRVAASHLARAILLHYGKLDVARSTQLLALTLDRLGVA